MKPIILLILAGLLPWVTTSELTTNMSFLGVWERHSLVGVETCKMKCVRKVSCRAVLYSPASISCFLTLARAPASPPPGLILIAKETIKVHGKKCRDICRNGVCMKSHSLKLVCGIRHCVEFLRPPVIPFSSVTVNLTEEGAKALYRCHTNYTFFQKNLTQHVMCHVNCSWETPRFKCIDPKVDPYLLSSDAQHIPLPVHFGRGKTLQICGIPRYKASFTINLVRKKDILLYMNPRFKVGYDKRRICFAVCKNGKFKHESKAKVFFFKFNAPFCMSIRRIPDKYQLLDGRGKVRHTVKDYFKRKSAYNLSVSEVELISVEMAMT